MPLSLDADAGLANALATILPGLGVGLVSYGLMGPATWQGLAIGFVVRSAVAIGIALCRRGCPRSVSTIAARSAWGAAVLAATSRVCG